MMIEKTEIADMTAVEMVAQFQVGEVSPVEAARACLKRIADHNDAVNAYNYLDEQTTLAAARRAEERWRRGIPLGPVDGVPVAIKDIFVTKGWPNRKGSRITSDAPGEVDAPAVAALRRSGLVPLGRTTTPEFGWKGVTDNRLDGVSSNPWDPTKVCGGSSGGSGAAVALGMGPWALGTDAGGSIRIPAGFCGIVGHKPTHGLCPMWPPSAFYPLAVVGPMTWTVADAALFLDVLTRRDPRDPTLPANPTSFRDAIAGEDLAGWRIAFSGDLGYVSVAPDIARAVAAAARVFEEAGAIVEQCHPGFDDPLESFNRLFYSGAANALRGLGDEQRAEMDPGLVEVAEWAGRLSMLDYLEAANQRAALLERTSCWHQHWDLLVTPTLPIAAFDAGREVPIDWPDDRWPTWTPFTYPFNLTGQPAVSVPCGQTDEGLPIGMQIVGARHDDARVLRAAHFYQQARPRTDQRPVLS